MKNTFASRLAHFLSLGIRDILFGIQDGLVSTMGVLTGIATGTGDHLIVIISGLVVIGVESLSMGAGSFISSKANRQYQEKLLAQEKKEIEDHLDQEEEELIQMYQKRGFTPDEIDIIKKRLLSDTELLLEDMAHKELGIVPQRFENPFLNSLFMGISYVCGGIIPVLPYLFFENLMQGLVVSVALTVLALFIVGAVKGALFGISWLRSGLEMLIVAGSTGLLGYGIGYVGKHLILLNHL